MSRVAKFRAAHPDIEVRIVASAPVKDLAGAGVDLAISVFSTSVSGSDVTYDIEVNTSLDTGAWTVVQTFNPVADGTLSATVPSAAFVRNFVRVTATHP